MMKEPAPLESPENTMRDSVSKSAIASAWVLFARYKEGNLRYQNDEILFTDTEIGELLKDEGGRLGFSDSYLKTSQASLTWIEVYGRTQHTNEAYPFSLFYLLRYAYQAVNEDKFYLPEVVKDDVKRRFIQALAEMQDKKEGSHDEVPQNGDVTSLPTKCYYGMFHKIIEQLEAAVEGIKLLQITAEIMAYKFRAVVVAVFTTYLKEKEKETATEIIETIGTSSIGGYFQEISTEVFCQMKDAYEGYENTLVRVAKMEGTEDVKCIDYIGCLMEFGAGVCLPSNYLGLIHPPTPEQPPTPAPSASAAPAPSASAAPAPSALAAPAPSALATPAPSASAAPAPAPSALATPAPSASAAPAPAPSALATPAPSASAAPAPSASAAPTPAPTSPPGVVSIFRLPDPENPGVSCFSKCCIL